ncbi:hypothetical protein PAXRUDRAFT_203582 [Paxillus rubicundulus Ve08.2h10]|uniref:Uncharacterized protein n=1 Tax=Paxillus rubicundulus Ve08.2h10 TaxID=930991 RepID=A0A0D0DHX7_9AGAM|nr:hypothetical protein PAXRUDRAFT_203582 [Paxillus rubicundulus Ve08.2h10]
MVYRKISPDMKQRALELLEQGWEMEQVIEALDVSTRSLSINCWADNYEQHGRVAESAICPSWTTPIT